MKIGKYNIYLWFNGLKEYSRPRLWKCSFSDDEFDPGYMSCKDARIFYFLWFELEITWT